MTDTKPTQRSQKCQDDLDGAEARLVELKAQLEQLYHQMKITKEQMEEIQQMLEENQDKIRSLSTVEAEIEKIKPMIDKASEAMKSMDEKQLAEVASYKKPPARIKMCLEAITLILTGKTLPWDAIQKEMANDFVDRVLKINWKKVKKSVLEKLKKDYFENPEWQLDKIKRASKAMGPLAEWMDAQYRILELKKNSEDTEEVKALKAERKKAKQEQEEISKRLKELADQETELKNDIYDANKAKEKILEDEANGLYNEKPPVSYKEIGVGNEIETQDFDCQCDRIAESKVNVGVAVGDDLFEDDGFEMIERGTQTDHEITQWELERRTKTHEYVNKTSRDAELINSEEQADKQVQCVFVDYYTIETQTDQEITQYYEETKENYEYKESFQRDMEEIEQILQRRTETEIVNEAMQVQFVNFYTTTCQTDHQITNYFEEESKEGYEFIERVTKEYSEINNEKHEQTEITTQCNFMTLYSNGIQTDKGLTGYIDDNDTAGYDFDIKHFKIEEEEENSKKTQTIGNEDNDKQVQCRFETLYSTPTQTEEYGDGGLKKSGLHDSQMKEKDLTASYINKASNRYIMNNPNSDKQIQCDFMTMYSTDTQTDYKITNFDNEFESEDYTFIEKHVELKDYAFAKKKFENKYKEETKIVSQRDLLLSNRSIRDIDFNHELDNKRTQCHFAVYYTTAIQTDNSLTGYLAEGESNKDYIERQFKVKEFDSDTKDKPNKANQCHFAVCFSQHCQTDNRITNYDSYLEDGYKSYIPSQQKLLDTSNIMVQTENDRSFKIASSRNSVERRDNLSTSNLIKAEPMFNNQPVTVNKAEPVFNKQPVAVNKTTLPLLPSSNKIAPAKELNTEIYYNGVKISGNEYESIKNKGRSHIDISNLKPIGDDRNPPIQTKPRNDNKDSTHRTVRMHKSVLTPGYATENPRRRDSRGEVITEYVDVKQKRKRSKSIVKVEQYHNNPEFMRNQDRFVKHVNITNAESKNTVIQNQTYRGSYNPLSENVKRVSKVHWSNKRHTELITTEKVERTEVVEKKQQKRADLKKPSILDTRMDKILLKK